MLLITDDRITVMDLSRHFRLEKVWHSKFSDLEVYGIIRDNWDTKCFCVRNQDNYFGICDAINSYHYFGDSDNFIRISEISQYTSIRRFLSNKGPKRLLLAECSISGRTVLRWSEFSEV